MTAVYLRLHVFGVSTFSLGWIEGHKSILVSEVVSRRVSRVKLEYKSEEHALKCKTYFVAKEQISLTENLWLYRCEDRGI